MAIVAVTAPLSGQWTKEAQAVVNAPIKVTGNPLQQGQQEGKILDFEVQLKNGKSQPTKALVATPVNIELLNTAGAVVRSGSCQIAANSVAGTCTVQAPQSGIYKFRVRPKNHELLEETGYVLIRPKDSAQQQPLVPKPPSLKAAPSKKAPDSKSPSRKLSGRGSRRWQGAGSAGIQFLSVAYHPEEQDNEPAPPVARSCSPPKSRGRAKVVLLINDGNENGAFRAGIESATIQALFVAEDGGSAPSDILVWLSPDHGTLDQQPLKIPKCSISGESHLSSKYAVKASIRYTVVPPNLPVEGPARLQASFVQSIIGIGIIPNGKQTLSLIDRGLMVAHFFDINGATVPTDLERTVKFVSGNSIVSAKDQSIVLKPGAFSAETLLLPFWLGNSSIYVTADRLKTATHHVEIVGMTVIFICLIGGLVGALVSFLTAGGVFYSRVIVGVAAGIVLTWAYVFGVLPKVDAVLAHNFISVFVVSVLGGYLGIKAFEIVLKLFGWGSQARTSSGAG